MELGITGPAQSDNLFHFTGRVGGHPNDVPRHIQDMTPEERLDSILAEQKLRAFPPFGVSLPCVCFSESPPEHLAFLINRLKVKPWGIVVGRSAMLKLGGGAVAYVPDTVYEYFKNVGMGHWAVRVGPTSSWMHEREWRLPRQDGAIKLGGVRAILIGDEKWRPSLVETDEPETLAARPRKDYPQLWRESEIWVWDSKNDSVVTLSRHSLLKAVP